MTEINTFQDLLRALDENPEWREALREKILTQELLQLPAVVFKLSESLHGLLEEMSGHLLRLAQSVATQSKQVDDGFAQVNDRFVRVDAWFDTINQRLDGMSDDLEQVKDYFLKNKLHRIIRSLLGQHLGLRRVQIMQGDFQETSSRLYEPVDSCAEEGRITEEQEMRISSTDLIVYARRNENHRYVWVAVEASSAVSAQDIERARATADALETVFGEEVVAVVVGYSIGQQDQQRAEEAGVVYLEAPRSS